MKLFWGSDLHLDHIGIKKFNEFIDEVKNSCSQENSILLLTGDTTVAKHITAHHTALANACNGSTMFVLGNHDRWGSSFSESYLFSQQVTKNNRNASFMDDCDCLEIENGTYVVGDSGWYDGRNGLQTTPRFIMNDWFCINEYRGKEPFRTSAIIADARAKILEDKIRKGIASGAKKLIVLMHVPPFEESCRYMGRPSDDFALPWFSSQIFGDTLDQVAAEFPHVMFEVLCGHTHDAYVYQRKNNLKVSVAGAQYGDPKIKQWSPTLW